VRKQLRQWGWLLLAALPAGMTAQETRNPPARPPVRPADPPGDWAMPGRDAGVTRFSPLNQITPVNVAT